MAAEARAAGRRAADLLEEGVRSALAARDAAALAVSGGRTPAAMLRDLFGRPLPWARIRIFQVDERVAPRGSPDRNLTLLEAAARAGAPGAVEALRPMPVEDPDLEAAAAAYEALLLREAPDGLDAVHLGLGADGHTASWPPGDPVLEEIGAGARRVAAVGPHAGRVRLTLTPRAVAEARRVVFLVLGAEKAAALAGLLRRDPALPASRVPRRRATVVADRAAAAEASPGGAPRSPGPGRGRAR